jgi:hypothetical protein
MKLPIPSQEGVRSQPMSMRTTENPVLVLNKKMLRVR